MPKCRRTSEIRLRPSRPYRFRYELTPEALEDVLGAVPGLTRCGFNCCSDEKFTMDLLGEGGQMHEEFQEVVNYILRFCSPSTTACKDYSSYGFKLLVQEFRAHENMYHGKDDTKVCAVSNGTVILAALLLGYKIKLYNSSPYCAFYWRTTPYTQHISF